MAYLTLAEYPEGFKAAYAKPILWGVTSMRSPLNLMAGETMGVVSISEATAADVATYGAPLVEGDVFIIHGAIAPDIFVAGQQVLIEGTADGLYDGLHRIKYDVTSTVTVIDTEYIGDDSNGSIAKNYENYRLILYAATENHTDLVRYVISPDAAGTFYWNAADLCATTFKDVFNIAVPGDTSTNVNAGGYFTQEYTGTFYEAYMVPNVDGINEYTEFDKGETIEIRGYAYNGVQPYHHVDEQDGSVDHAWEDDADIYTLSNGSDDTYRFATYAPRGFVGSTKKPDLAVPIATSDDYWLPWLWDGTPTAMKFEVVSFTQSGGVLGNSVIDFTAFTAGNLIPCGPNNLGANIEPGAHHYTVQILDTSLLERSERFVFRIDNSCTNAPRRLFALNEFGGIDGYTLTGREARETSVTRETVYRRDMPQDLRTSTRVGSTQRRVFATNIRRNYTNTTRTESKKTLRWLVDCFFESPDIRTCIYENTAGEKAWTTVIIDTETLKMGGIAGRMPLAYSFGIDEQKQRA